MNHYVSHHSRASNNSRLQFIHGYVKVWESVSQTAVLQT